MKLPTIMESKNSTILVVDDQSKNLQLVATVLKNKYRLILATDGVKAIEVAKDKIPDLILLDIMMPDFSGIDVCKRLKNEKKTKDIPIIFLTARTEEEDILEAYDVGGVDYVTKPFKSKELIARINTHIRINEQQEEILKLNKELQASNLQKDKLFTTIAHDLRGPANAVHSALEMLSSMTGKISEEDLDRFLGMLVTNTQGLQDLLEDLLLWSSRQFKKRHFELLVFNLIESVDQVFTHLKPQADEKKIRLLYNTNDDLIVKADKTMFIAIMRNLLSNAIKFSNTGSTIKVEAARKDDKMVAISVIDRGKGIKEEDLDKLFDPSVLFTTYGTEGEKGTGIGLDMCKEFVEQHGGWIKVESKEGFGSKFTFTMPAAM